MQGPDPRTNNLMLRKHCQHIVGAWCSRSYVGRKSG